MVANRRWGAVALFFTFFLTALSGCSDSDRTGAFTIDEVRYWFEGDLIVVNVTLTNHGDSFPYTPELVVDVDEFRADPAPEDGRVGNDLEWLITENDITIYFDAGLTESRNRDGWHQRYHENAIYSRPLPPNVTISFEFGIKPTNRFSNDSGYYEINIEMFAPGADNDFWASTHFFSGCFNHNVKEFYGEGFSLPDCYYYEEDGLDSESGYALFGHEHVGIPRMIHEPPRNIPNAH